MDRNDIREITNSNSKKSTFLQDSKITKGYGNFEMKPDTFNSTDIIKIDTTITNTTLNYLTS